MCNRLMLSTALLACGLLASAAAIGQETHRFEFTDSKVALAWCASCHLNADKADENSILYLGGMITNIDKKTGEVTVRLLERTNGEKGAGKAKEETYVIGKEVPVLQRGIEFKGADKITLLERRDAVCPKIDVKDGKEVVSQLHCFSFAPSQGFLHIQKAVNLEKDPHVRDCAQRVLESIN